MAGLAVLVTVGVYGYVTSPQRLPADVPFSKVGEAIGKVVPASAGEKGSQARLEQSYKTEDSGKVSSSPAAAPPSSQTRSSAVASGAGRQTVESPKRKPAAAPTGAAQRDCTSAIAALGLCQQEAPVSEDTQAGATANVPEAARVTAAAIAPALSPAVASALRAEECTEAVAALALCTPAPKDKEKRE